MAVNRSSETALEEALPADGSGSQLFRPRAVRSKVGGLAIPKRCFLELKRIDHESESPEHPGAGFFLSTLELKQRQLRLVATQGLEQGPASN